MKTWQMWLFLFCGWALCACGNDPCLLVVQINGIQHGNDWCRITVQVGDASADPVQAPCTDKIGLHLPTGPSGSLRIQVEELDSRSSCVVAEGHEEPAVSVSGACERHEVAVSLAALPKRRCCINVIKRGEGADGGAVRFTLPPDAGTVDMGSTTCQVQLKEDPAAMVELQPELPSGSSSYFAGWLSPGSQGCTTTNLAEATCAVRGDQRVVAVFGRRDCTSDGRLCWENPLPQGNRLNAVWGLSTNDLWAVGNVGTILHWDGYAWSGQGMRLGTQRPTRSLLALWGIPTSDGRHVKLWAVGEDGTLCFYEGNSTPPSWRCNQLGKDVTWTGVIGTSAADLWLVGQVGSTNGRICHSSSAQADPFNSWSCVDGGAPWNAVGGLSATQVLVVGNGGHFCKVSWDGSKPTILGSCAGPDNQQRDLIGLWPAPSGQVWIIADNKANSLKTPLLRWNENAQILEEEGQICEANKCPHLFAIHGAGKDIWAVGDTALRFDGDSWVKPDTIPDVSMRSIFALDSEHVWAGGEVGAIWSWNNSKGWSKTAGGASLEMSTRLNAVWSRGLNDTWVVGGVQDSGVVLKRNPKLQRWLPVSTPQGALNAIASTGPGSFWAVGHGGLALRFDSGQPAGSQTIGTAELRGAWGDSTGGAYAVSAFDGMQQFWRLSNKTWQMVDALKQADLHRLFGFRDPKSGVTTLWALGNGSLVLSRAPTTPWMEVVDLEYDNNNIKIMSTEGIWASTANLSDIWIVGRGGVFNSQKQALAPGVVTGTADLRGIWGCVPPPGQKPRLWAVGGTITSENSSEGGTVLKREPDTEFSLMQRLSTSFLSDVAGDPADPNCQVWSVGTSGAILRGQ